MNEDMPWVELTQEEVDELREKKYELTEYGKQKLKEKFAGNYPGPLYAPHPDLTQDKPFYRFFAIDYFATGEGRSFWLMICRNYPSIDDKDSQKDKFVNFIGMGASYYMHGFEELTQDEFLDKYGKFVSDYVIEMIAREDQPAFTWQTHLHFNYS